MHFRCMFTLLKWLCAGRIELVEPMMFLLLHITCLCIFMHMYLTFSMFLYTDCDWCFFACLSLYLSLLLSVSCSMVPKQKSTLSWIPLRSRASFSSDHTPSYVQFRDDKAWQDFLEKFSRRGVHSECQVILSNFSNIDLPTVIHSRGWESLCDVLVTCPSMLIHELYSNMHGFDYSVPLFVTRVRGTRIVVTPDIVSDMLLVPRVAHLDYPSCDRLKIVSKDKLISSFCKRHSN